MDNCKSANYLVFILSFALLTFSIVLVVFNKRLFGISDNFVNCYPNSSYGDVKSSYNSSIKGWCTKGTSINGNDSSDNFGGSNVCGRNSSTVSHYTSHNSKTKSWCRSDNGF